MKKETTIAVLIILAVIIFGLFIWIFLNYDSQNNNLKISNKKAINSGAFEIEITSSGFSPQRLEINAGEKVRFINKDSANHWPATNIHPTHSVYPGSDIDKCGGPEQEGIFDACRGLGQGEVWEFTFNEIGTWNYHDHLNPRLTGVIIVE